MTVDLQFKIKQNPNYLRYLREHSYWYKQLNRDAKSFARFEEEVKEVYQLSLGDRMKKTLDSIEFVSSLLQSLK